MGTFQPLWYEVEDRVVFPLIISPNAIQANGFVCEIYLAGCDTQNKPCAKVCHNKELQDFDRGKQISVVKLFEELYKYLESEAITEVHWLGGEPLVNENRIKFIYGVSKLIKTKFPHIAITVFTGYDEEEAFNRARMLSEVIDFLKVGPFLKAYAGIKKVSPTFELSSTNQNLYQITPDLDTILIA